MNRQLQGKTVSSGILDTAAGAKKQEQGKNAQEIFSRLIHVSQYVGDVYAISYDSAHLFEDFEDLLFAGA